MASKNFSDLLIPLHLISLAGEYLSGKTRLQKLVFLSQIEFNGNFDFNFGKAPLGPLSYKLLDIVDELIDLGFIKRQQETTDFGYKVFRYSVTEEGKQFLEFGKEKSLLTTQTISANESVMKEYGSIPHVQLLDYVHNEYPNYRITTN